MIHLAIMFALTVILFMLVKRDLIYVDMSLPWFLAILVLGFFSMSEKFVNWIADGLGILYPPTAVILLTIFFILGLITLLLIAYSRLRQRQLQIVRAIAAMELRRQEGNSSLDSTK